MYIYDVHICVDIITWVVVLSWPAFQQLVFLVQLVASSETLPSHPYCLSASLIQVGWLFGRSQSWSWRVPCLLQGRRRGMLPFGNKAWEMTYVGVGVILCEDFTKTWWVQEEVEACMPENMGCISSTSDLLILKPFKFANIWVWRGWKATSRERPIARWRAGWRGLWLDKGRFSVCTGIAIA